MHARLTVVTLGVDDLDRAVRFYRDGLGWPTEGIVGTEFAHGAVAFFDLQPAGLRLALWPRTSMAHDTGLPHSPRATSDLTLGHNVASREAVDAAMHRATAAGARTVKPAQPTFWGGYAGYFQDPDGHTWEVVWNPAWDDVPSDAVDPDELESAPKNSASSRMMPENQSHPTKHVPELVSHLYALVAKLEALFPARAFTPDGHLVGSIGEVLAAHKYNLALNAASTAGYDAVANDGRQVEIKATQGNSVALRSPPEHLIVLKLERDGSATEIFNGPGTMVWERCGALQKNGQRAISLGSLRALMNGVSPSERLPSRND